MDCSVILAVALACVSPVPGAGQTPPPAQTWQQMYDLAEQFRTDAQRRRQAGEITPEQFRTLLDLVQDFRGWVRDQERQWRVVQRGEQRR